MASQSQFARLELAYTKNPQIGRLKLSKESSVSLSMAQRYLEWRRNGGLFPVGNLRISLDDHVAGLPPTEEGQPCSESLDDSCVKVGDACNVVANCKNRPYTVEEIAALFDIDMDVWEAKRVTTNHWDVTNKDGTTYKNYQTKVVWSRDPDRAKMSFIKKLFAEELQDMAPYQFDPIKEYIVTAAEKMLEINIRDLHLGKLCWRGETGEDYDSKIAAARFHFALDDLLTKASVFGYEQIVICASDDFFNADDVHGNTTSGTYQCTDVRWQKMFRLGRELMCQAIDKLRTYAPVKVIMATGNHDTQRSFFLGEVLSAVYHNCDNVEIDNSPKGRKYHRYGNVLLGFTHGNGLKQHELPLIMAQEAPKDWGETKYREFHVAHFHKSKQIKYVDIDENIGFVIRQMRSLTGTDSWHYEKGYVGSIKGAEAFIWDKESGLVAQFESHIDVGKELSDK